MTDRVFYEELTPQDFRERIAAAPIAYLPLGTLEWHGEHLPLGSDGIQSRGFFEVLARRVGGIVLPMLFLGPDRKEIRDGQELYGMDICKVGPEDKHYYPTQKLDGSAYRVSDEAFNIILESALSQLARAGFKIVVGHGHGPSTLFFYRHKDEWKERFGLECFHCWGSDQDAEGLGIQVDHAAMNETSLVMAFRPELVKMENLPEDMDKWPVGIGGKDPRLFASAELGHRIVEMQTERMVQIIKKALSKLDR